MRRIVSTTNSGMTTGFAAKQSAPDSDPSRERLLGSPPPELLSLRVELLADQGNGTRVPSTTVFKAAGRADREIEAEGRAESRFVFIEFRRAQLHSKLDVRFQPYIPERIHALACQFIRPRCGSDSSTCGAARVRYRHKVSQRSGFGAGGEESVRRPGGGRAGREKAMCAQWPVVSREDGKWHGQDVIAGGRNARFGYAGGSVLVHLAGQRRQRH